MPTRFTDGAVTVTLDDGLDIFVRDALSAASKETVRVLEKAAGKVSKAGKAEWYGPNGVERESGKSGDLDTVTTFDSARSEVRVSVVSSDTRTAGKSGKPVPLFVHRPGPLSLIKRRATHEDFKAGKAKSSPRGKKVAGRGVVEELNPKHSDGKYLVAELIRKPMRAAVPAITAELGDAIIARLNRGGG